MVFQIKQKDPLCCTNNNLSTLAGDTVFTANSFNPSTDICFKANIATVLKSVNRRHCGIAIMQCIQALQTANQKRIPSTGIRQCESHSDHHIVWKDATNQRLYQKSNADLNLRK